MLNIILIQHIRTEIKLLGYRQVTTKISSDHTDIFSGFMSAIQNIASELDIGTLILLSTEGSKGHNCIIAPKPPVNVILLVDQDDPVDHWREQGHLIANEFITYYGTDFDPSNVTKFEPFISTIKQLCALHDYCD